MAHNEERRPGEGAPIEVPGAGGNADAKSVVPASTAGSPADQRNPFDVSTAFLNALFVDPLEGLIEVRLIEEKQPGTRRRPEVVCREWYESVGRLVGDLPRLLRVAEEKRAAVFFGVLPAGVKVVVA